MISRCSKLKYHLEMQNYYTICSRQISMRFCSHCTEQRKPTNPVWETDQHGKIRSGTLIVRALSKRISELRLIVARLEFNCKHSFVFSLLKTGPMRPQTASLSRAPYRNLLTCRIPSGARGFAATALSLRGNSNRPILSKASTCLQQQRWITQNYIKRMKDGEEEWARFARQIKAGKRLNFAQHLEERGLIHDVVG